MSGPIIVGVDGSESGWRAVGRSVRLAGALGIDLVAAYVPHHPAIADFSPEALAAELQVEADIETDIRAHLTRVAPGAQLHVLGPGRPGPELAQLAEELGAELIVVATRGRGPISRAALGSVAHHLVSHATVPVLVER